MQVQAYLGLGSRYSYLASTQLARIETATGCRFEWIPVNSAELIRLGHFDHSPFEAENLHGQYHPVYRELDARRWAEFYGVPYHAPKIGGLAPSDMAQACWCPEDAEIRQAMCRTVFDEVFAKGTEMSGDVLVHIASDFGISRRDLLSALDGGRARELHRKAISDAASVGVFGVPTFVVGDVLFWGNDRLPLVERHLLKDRH